jgi:prepilin-type N-terminal cleavage/methylation domain-containing protein
MKGRDGSGFTLVEVLVAVVILGIAALGIIPAVQALVLSSENHRGQASADSVLRSYAEVVERKALSTSIACPSLADLTPTASEFPGTGWAFTVTGVIQSATPDYWIPAADFRSGTWSDAAACANHAAAHCPALSPPPAECGGGLIRLRLTDTSTTVNPKHSTPSATTELLIRRGQS